MSQSRTRFIGLEVHQDAIAVASVAQDHGAEGMSLGALGTRQGDLEQMVRKRPSKATHLLCVSEAGPCGSWRSRSLTTKGDACWVVAPALIPKQPGARVTTDRRDAVQRARLARSGALTAVSVPTVADAAMRALTRAREDALSDLTEAQCRRTAFWLRHDIRYVGRAHGHPAHLRGRSAGVGPISANLSR
jgi:transposase